MQTLANQYLFALALNVLLGVAVKSPNKRLKPSCYRRVKITVKRTSRNRLNRSPLARISEASMNRYVIEYQYGTYHGEKVVWADDEDQAISKMWAEFRRAGALTLTMAYQSAKVVSCEQAAG